MAVYRTLNIVSCACCQTGICAHHTVSHCLVFIILKKSNQGMSTIAKPHPSPSGTLAVVHNLHFLLLQLTRMCVNKLMGTRDRCISIYPPDCQQVHF